MMILETATKAANLAMSLGAVVGQLIGMLVVAAGVPIAIVWGVVKLAAYLA